MALTALPIIGIGAGIATLLLELGVGKGCGEPCIDAAKAEQVFESAGDYVLEAGRQGMLGRAAVVEALQSILSQGKQSLASIGTKQSSAGSRNMEKVIRDLISAANQLPDAPTMPLDAGKIQKIFDSLLDTRPGHWYADAVASGQTVAGQAIAQTSQVSQAIAAAQGAEVTPAAAASPVGSSGEFTSPSGGMKPPLHQTEPLTASTVSVQSIVDAARAHPVVALALLGAAGWMAIEVIS